MDAAAYDGDGWQEPLRLTFIANYSAIPYQRDFELHDVTWEIGEATRWLAGGA